MPAWRPTSPRGTAAIAITTVEQAKAPAGKPASASDAKDDLNSLPIPEIEKRLQTTPEGLIQAEATMRLEKYGPNEIPERKTNAILKLLCYFWGSIPLDPMFAL
jgi:H+-transporting ATPase